MATALDEALRVENGLLRERIHELHEENRRHMEEKDRLFARLEAAQQHADTLLLLLSGQRIVDSEQSSESTKGHITGQ